MPGSIEDRYRSLLLIGRGGMGTVEVAIEHPEEGSERVVALKRLLPEASSDPRRKEMFLREARLAALLAHPNVVHVYAFGELYGELFMAMEYLEGEPLSHVLRAARERDGALPAALVAFILAQVCDGLHAAHELRDEGGRGQPLNVVHRDVSPHNVMIAYEGQVKLLDFGVAKFEAAGHESRTGEVKGKMAYMSPEQALGERLDRRSDLFSVGAVLFECLTGERMWGVGTDLEVMRRLALEEPPRLDAVMPSAPPDLVALHARLVARDLDKRQATAHEVATELRAFAASAVPAPTNDAVRALMHELFGAQAAQRRAILMECLENAAPSRVEELRRSFEATALAHTATTSTEPLIVRSRPARVSPRRFPLRAIAVAALVALFGTILASFLAQKQAPQPVPAAAAPPVASITLSAALSAVPTAATPSAAVVASAAASTPAFGLPTVGEKTVAALPTTGTPTSAPARQGASAAAPSASSPHTLSSAGTPAPRPRPPSEAPAQTAPMKLPDVDPTPF
jgi:serine/threonine-protein kinase